MSPKPSYQVRQNDRTLHDLDVAVFRAINHGPEAFSGLMVFLSDATQYWPVRIGLIALFIAFCIHPRLRRPAILAAVAALTANTLTDVIKHNMVELRPSVEVADAIVRVAGGRGYGTVSAHSANMMAVATAFFFTDKRWGYGWLVIAILTGLSRIYVGVHYPSQVLMGWALGAAVAAAFCLATLKLFPHREEHPSEPKDPSSPESPPSDLQPGTEP